MQPLENNKPKPIRESGSLASTDGVEGTLEDISSGIKNLTETTRDSLEADAKRDAAVKKSSLIKKSFDSVKKGTAGVAENGLKGSKGAAKSLLNSTPMGMLASKIADFTGVSEKLGSAFDSGVDKLAGKDEKDDSGEEVKSAIKDSTTAITQALNKPAKSIDKDVKVEQAIQADKDRIVFEDMRDYLEEIADKEESSSSYITPEKKEKKKDIFSKLFELLGKKFLGPLKSIGGEIGSILSSATGKMGGVLKGFTGKFGGMVSKMGGMFNGLTGKLSGLFTGKNGFLSKLGTMLKGGVGGKLMGGLGKMGGMLTKGLKFLGPVGAALGVAANGLGGFMEAENIFGKDATIGNKISSTIGGIVSGLSLGLVSTGTMAKGIQGAADAVSDAASWAGDKLMGGVTAMGKQYLDGADWLGEKLGLGANAYSGAMTKGADYLGATFDDGILNGFGTILGDASGWFGDTMKSANDSILGVFGTSTDEMGENLKSSMDDMLDMFSGVGDWFSDKFKGISESAGSAWNWVKGKAGSAVDSVKSGMGFSKKSDKKFKNSGDFYDDINASIMKEETGHAGGTFNAAKDIGDGAGISFGAHQLTEKSGGVKEYVQKMAKGGDSKAQDILKGFGKNKRFQGDKTDLIKYLKSSGNSKEGKKTQEDMYNRKYRDPAIKLAKKYGITDKGAIAQLIDHSVNAGLGGAERMLKKAGGDYSSGGLQEARKQDYRGLKTYKKYGKTWEGRVDRTADRMKQYEGGSKTLREGLMGKKKTPLVETKKDATIWQKAVGVTWGTKAGSKEGREERMKRSTEALARYKARKNMNTNGNIRSSIESNIASRVDPERLLPKVVSKIKGSTSDVTTMKEKIKMETLAKSRNQKKLLAKANVTSSSQPPVMDGGSMPIESSKPASAPSFPKKGSTGPSKSSVMDSDLLLLSGVFLNK